MKNRTIKILLFASLAFNIAFLGGGVFKFMQMRKFPPVHERIKNDKVKEFMRIKREIGGDLAQDFHKQKDEFMKALAVEDINEDELRAMIDNMIEKQTAMEKEIGNSLIELRKELSSDEAKQVFGKFRKWMQPKEKYHHDKDRSRRPGKMKRN